MMGKPIEILLVEDNPGDVRLTQETLRDGKMRNNMHVTWDGVEALEFLHRAGKYADAPRPDLILLDLNLPKKDGREVLVEIKEDGEPETYPRRCPDYLKCGTGHPQSLQPACELLYLQTC